MFDEIPPPRREYVPSYPAMFALYFALYLACAMVAGFRLHAPLSVKREVELVQAVIGGLLSGSFLLTAKSASPKANRMRLIVLIATVATLQFVIAILQ